MPEEKSTQDGENTSEATSGAGDSFQAITSQDDLNRIIAERVQREKAKYSDYKDLRAKAAKLDEIEEANKTEAQRLSDEKVAAELERDQARSDALRLKVAIKHGVSDEDADLFLTGTDEDTLTKQAERLAQRAEDRTSRGNYVPGEGSNPAAKNSGSTADLFADAVGDALNR